MRKTTIYCDDCYSDICDDDKSISFVDSGQTIDLCHNCFMARIKHSFVIRRHIKCYRCNGVGAEENITAAFGTGETIVCPLCKGHKVLGYKSLEDIAEDAEDTEDTEDTVNRLVRHWSSDNI